MSSRSLRYQVLAIVCFVQVLLQLVLLGTLAVAQDYPGVPLTLIYDTWTGRTSPGVLNVGKSGTTSTTIQSADKTGGGNLFIKEDATNGVVSLVAKDGSGNSQTLFGCSAGQCAFGDVTNGSLLSSPSGTIAEMRAPSGACGRLSGNGGVVGTGTLVDACPGGLVLSKGAAISAAILPINGGGLVLPSIQLGSSTVISTHFASSVSLTAGSATATVGSGAVCICTDRTAAAAVKCSTSGTTLTINGTGTDSINYICET